MQLRNQLKEVSSAKFSAYCIVAAFGTYFCMYAFRKPFTAATFEDTIWLGIGFKTILVAAQVSGYTISKFVGIKVISEMPARHRATTILVLIAIAELALLLFAITPVPWNFVWLFVNGLPLGMVFGLVLGFLEGRKVTEALSAGLCASFIVSSGAVKSVGHSLIHVYQVNEYWMPFLTGLIFVVPLLIFVWLLSQIPPPSRNDEELRSKREPMYHADRKAFFKRHAIGLTALIAIYILLTIVRSIRDDFAVEIWQGMGVAGKPKVFATSETWVAIGVVIINGSIILVRNNRIAFLASMGLLAAGFAIVLLAITGFHFKVLSPMMFMILLGLGMYIPYVAFHTTVFERMLAAFKEVGTIGYLMYLADAIGYLGYVAIMILRNSVDIEIDFLQLMIWTSIGVSLASTAITIFLTFYFQKKMPKHIDANADESGEVATNH